MTRRLIPAAALLILISACTAGTIGVDRSDGEIAGTGRMAYGDAADSTDDFDVEIAQPDAPPVMGNTTKIDVRYQITVRNRTQEPVTVRRIALQGAGGAYEIEWRSRPFDVLIEPDAKAKMEFWATATDVDPSLGTRAPVMVRAQIEFQQGDAKRKEAFIRRVNGHAAIGVQ